MKIQEQMYEFMYRKDKLQNKLLFFCIIFYIIYLQIAKTKYAVLPFEIILKYSFPFFLLYIFSCILLTSKEKVMISRESIRIQKYFLIFCYYDKHIEMRKIRKILFRKFLTKEHIFVCPLFDNAYSNLIFQVDMNGEEDKAYYFGKFLDRQKFLEIMQSIKTVVEGTQILFLYH
ncbi:hypothetical protein FUSO4_12415 [Fusobacterium necrophorum DJ-1]|uniref:Transmembrane protein n=2 Tax=Fusobacterium necrophorum TaxID=859 RepID=A0AB73C0E1_9FUSO|nr:hypothetical protein FUSO4_12415 [Fusobacterium necrophorum DJ-1]KDE69637.1 hypothetical protein FUSO8_11075 [Fusobacterium necrophorum DJ-2]